MEPSDYKAQRVQKVTLRTVILGGLIVRWGVRIYGELSL